MKKIITVLLIFISIISFAQKVAFDESEIANSYFNKKDYINAIYHYTQAIERADTYYSDIVLVALTMRCCCRFAVNDFYGAISDATEGLNVASAPLKLWTHTQDETDNMKLDSKKLLYKTRGDSYWALSIIPSACPDWSKAFELGDEQSYQDILKYCQ